MNLIGSVYSTTFGWVSFSIRPRAGLDAREYDCWIYREPNARFRLGRVRFNADRSEACLTLDAMLNVGETTVSQVADMPETLTTEFLVGRAIDRWRELATIRFERSIKVELSRAS